MTLTTSQLLLLKAAIAAETDPTFVTYRTNGQPNQMAAFFNQSSTFVVYKKRVELPDVGMAFDAAALDAMTSGNSQKLSTFKDWLTYVVPERADHQAYFNGIFSGTGGATTRTSLDALWRRFATRVEKLFATGTGTTLVPGSLVWEGNIYDTDIQLALAS